MIFPTHHACTFPMSKCTLKPCFDVGKLGVEKPFASGKLHCPCLGASCNIGGEKWKALDGVFSHTLESRLAQFNSLAFTTSRHLHMVVNPIFTLPVPKHHLRVTKRPASISQSLNQLSVNSSLPLQQNNVKA